MYDSASADANAVSLTTRLEEALAWQREIFEGSRDAVFLSDQEGRFVAVNRAATELTGFSRDELLAMRIPDLHDEPGLAAYRSFHRRIFEGERILSEAPVRRKDGSQVLVEFNNTAVVIGGRRCMHTVGRDVTERKTAIEALAASEMRYRALFENALEGILAVDPDSWRFSFFNPALCAMLGYTPDELRKLTVTDIHPNEALQEVSAAFSRLTSGARVMSEAIPCLRKDGTTFLADIRANQIDVSGRKVVFGFFTDITERVRLEEQVRQSQKMEAIGQLAGGVAHDFNNALTVISGNTEILLKGTPEDDPSHAKLADIRNASERAANLTQQLLAFGRRQMLQPVLVDAHDVLARVESMLGRLIGEDVEITTALAARRSWVTVDPGQFEQVIINFALNARDAMPRGGRITIATRNVEESEPANLDPTAGLRSPPRIAISVSDTGTGMTPEVKARLFEPFFTTKEFGKGSGLGLATTFGFVKQSGGDISVETEPGKGTTFTVVLPAEFAPRRPRDSSGGSRAVPHGNETVLVVEDEDAVGRIVKITLESTGYRVIQARGGDEALEAARRNAGAIHLVITDVVRPGMSGRELVERIETEWPDVRVLYMSGHTDERVGRHGIEAGAAFLQKPFSPAALARKVRDVLDDEPDQRLRTSLRVPPEPAGPGPESR